jgi:hypothetical protein
MLNSYQVSRVHQKLDQTSPTAKTSVPHTGLSAEVGDVEQSPLQPAANRDHEEPQSPNYVLVRPIETVNEDPEEGSAPGVAGPDTFGQTANIGRSIVNRGLLFDGQGRPTPRLRYILSGIADYLVSTPVAA